MGRFRPVTPHRKWRGTLSLILLASVLSVATTAGAQTGGPVASGDFTGTVALDGGFTVVIPQSGGSITVLVNGSGPLQLTLTDGSMDGTWSLEAIQTMEGFMGESGAGLGMTGTGTISASGTMQGPPNDYRLVGAYSQTNTVSFGGFSSTSNDSGPLNEPLTEVIVLCDTIVGRWDLRIRQNIQDAGFEEFIRGYFTASTGVDATEQAEKLQTLLADVSRWAGEAPRLEGGRNALYIGRALALLARSQRLQAELTARSPCPPDATFTTQLTLAVQDVLNALLDRFPGITNTYIVSLALGSGAIGPGSPVPDAADQLQERLKASIQEKFERFINDPGVKVADLVDVARAAQMLGIERFAGGDVVADILLTFTIES